MEAEDNCQNSTKPFSQVNVGQVFIAGGVCCLKTVEFARFVMGAIRSVGFRGNSVVLAGSRVGTLRSFGDNDLVKVVNATLVVE